MHFTFFKIYFIAIMESSDSRLAFYTFVKHTLYWQTCKQVRVHTVKEKKYCCYGRMANIAKGTYIATGVDCEQGYTFCEKLC